MTQELPPERASREATMPPAVDAPMPASPTIAQDTRSHAPAAVQSLKQAMRRARYDDAERVGVMADLRAARLGRLELLEDALRPLSAQIPEDVDMFDFGLMPGAHPRLFIDMIGFVEMARDARGYRLLQDTRHGRVVLAESDSVDRMVDAVTDYVARRLLERDKALAAAADDENRGAPPRRSVQPTRRSPSPPLSEASGPPTRRRRSTTRRVAAATFAFLIDLLGSIAFFTILIGLGWLIWNRLRGQI